MTVEKWDAIYQRGEQLNRYPYPDVLNFIFRHGPVGEKGVAALDVGCGAGNHTRVLLELGFEVLAFDGSAGAIERVTETCAPWKERLSVQTASFADVALPERRFDLSIDRCASACAPTDVIAGLYRKIFRSLKPGGCFYANHFSDDHADLAFGTHRGDGYYTDFSDGAFRDQGTVSGLSRAQVLALFDGFEILKMVKETRVSALEEGRIDTAQWHVIGRRPVDD